MSGLGIVMAVYAAGDGGLQKCINQAADHGGVPPTCTKTASGEWVASWPDDSPSGGGGGVAGPFIAIILIGLILTAIGIWWRVTTAQRLARQAGLDPDTATQMALFTDNGLDATYLASSLRQPPMSTAPSESGAGPSRSVAERLAELTALRDQGVITAEEHDRRRAAIIDQM